ncbi:MAG: hypothetical protein ABI844_16565 [Saprospiraceae bacterium]
MKIVLNSPITVLIACLSLGLAPFFPEPHIWGKLKWVVGGARGMQLIDWLDLLFHGLPWILLMRIVVLRIVKKQA